jgi:hypothetical protein
MKTTLSVTKLGEETKSTTYLCEVCGYQSCYDLTCGMGDSRNVHCGGCGAHYYKDRWWTSAEWQAYVNEGFESEIARMNAANQSGKSIGQRKSACHA